MMDPSQPLVRISGSQNLQDYDAHQEGTEYRNRGRSLAEAIGNLILADPSRFNFVITFKGLSNRTGGVIREDEERSVPDSGGASTWLA